MKIKKKSSSTLFDLVEAVAHKNNLPVDTVSHLLAQALKTAFLKEYPDNVIDVVVNLKGSQIELNTSKPKVGDLVYKEVDLSTFDTKITTNIQIFFKKLTENEEIKDENLDYISIDDAKFFGSNKISDRIFRMHFKKSDDVLKDYFGDKFTEQTESKDQESDILEDYIHLLDVDQKDLISKTPVVTIMGHVDHGKTTLLDKIRGSNVTEGEFGGITQHIGAYQISKNGRSITFIDTPGHQAFTKLRARGAKVTDIVVIVIAADDGINRQTIEAIQHALLAKVKIIVFINKIDKGTKNVPNLKNSLMEHNIVLEEFGGDVIAVSGSALRGDGIDELLDTILLVSDMADIKTTNKDPAVGTIIESRMERGLGATATVLLGRGKIKGGDHLIMKSSICKVKSITDTNGKPIKELEQSVPAKISGFKGIPDAGDRFISFRDLNESKAKEMLQKLQEIERKKEITILEKPKGIEDLNFLIKCDVSGSMDAIKNVSHDMGIPVIYEGIGTVTDSDLQLAVASGSMIINFNQKIPNDISTKAKDMGITIKNYMSIYQIEEDIVQIIESKRIIEYMEERLGRAEVVKLWHHSKVGTIAGCKVISGTISKTDKIKVIRGDEILVSSTIKSFKTEDYEIKECSENQECGIVVNNWNNIKPGDIIEAFRMVEKEDKS
ncbi:translation initiation factor IF-2-like [Rattus rattus]|uniref:translation initiation factor IF-2-like n=1 Tax=Rattus rattus TaxID=10117 RepID=UPI0013F37D10|nr:translation initiation factor IF-2-like [Rattus rattus]